MSAPTPAERTLNIGNFLQVSLVSLAGLGGMLASIVLATFLTVPSWSASVRWPAIPLHLLLAAIALAFGVRLLVLSLRSGLRYRIASSATGLALLVLATGSGVGLMTVPAPAFAIAMAVFSTAAVIAYAFAIVRAHHVEE